MKLKVYLIFLVFVMCFTFASNLFAVSKYTEFCNAVKNNMDYSIPTKSVTIKNGSLIVITDLNRIDDNAYYTMVPSVCLDLNEYPEIAKQLKEVVFLNKWGKQGWVFEEPGQYDEIISTPVKKLKLQISFYTHMHTNK